MFWKHPRTLFGRPLVIIYGDLISLAVMLAAVMHWRPTWEGFLGLLWYVILALEEGRIIPVNPPPAPPTEPTDPE